MKPAGKEGQEKKNCVYICDKYSVAVANDRCSRWPMMDRPPDILRK